MELRGQLVAPQNTPAIPMAPERAWGRPSKGPARVPKAQPVNSTGTISPPRKPAPRVRAVKRIFSRKAAGMVSPSISRRMTASPAPL